jgi:hypothetical protein
MFEELARLLIARHRKRHELKPPVRAKRKCLIMWCDCAIATSNYRHRHRHHQNILVLMIGTVNGSNHNSRPCNSRVFDDCCCVLVPWSIKPRIKRYNCTAITEYAQYCIDSKNCDIIPPPPATCYQLLWLFWTSLYLFTTHWPLLQCCPRGWQQEQQQQ